VLNTPLHYALMNKNFKMADILIDRWTDQTLKNKENLTAWQYVGYNNN
jgi:hypothetical protein